MPKRLRPLLIGLFLLTAAGFGQSPTSASISEPIFADSRQPAPNTGTDKLGAYSLLSTDSFLTDLYMNVSSSDTDSRGILTPIYGQKNNVWSGSGFGDIEKIIDTNSEVRALGQITAGNYYYQYVFFWMRGTTTRIRPMLVYSYNLPRL